MSNALTPEIVPASTSKFALIIGETIGGNISSDGVINAIEQICLQANEVNLEGGGFDAAVFPAYRLEFAGGNYGE